ncbi:hypothetical protein PCANC_11632 [Puccinia coronata f. sp. avenae]|uniref:C2H2-type domain-containing protein n=1 Tax=Puccinia coronata f. sp. avenae TaxID=200324 RepID=A0A2N5SVL5_9BASI|nr:hypothetical protein PCANC_11632 [Puccinia coronata f. sp. avenae]
MSPADARRTEFVALAVDMVDCLESLQRAFDGPGSHQQSPSAYRYASTSNLNPHAPLSTTHSPYYDHYSSQRALSSSVGPSHLESTKTTNQYIPTHGLTSGHGSTYSISPPPDRIQADRHGLTPEYPTTRITNQKRAESINRGGSLRREAPADKVCEFCQASFTRNERLRYHIDSVHLKLEPEYACDVTGCQRAFRQRSDLLRHQRTVHRSLFPK